ncbi:MAG: hypothetical protein N3B13_06120, partial [Deltaproteobacteria bacterium]|nr:hypothetical protein [Deltaproteobacteria bacterium]
DKIDTIMVISDLFKTKEGIKVGSRLGEIKKKFNNLEIYADWLEEDPNALYAETPHYSNLKFIVDSSGFIRGLDNLESFKRLNFTDFKSNTQIIRIVITRDVVKSVIQK